VSSYNPVAMPYRKIQFTNEKIYHIYNTSTANSVIFRTTRDYERAVESLVFYTFRNPPLRYSHFKRLSIERKQEFYSNLDPTNTNVDVIAYSFLPDHYHLILRQKSDNGISKSIRNFQNSYAKHYNTKVGNSGAVFTALFKAKEIENEDILTALSRHIHLCPYLTKATRLDKLTEYKWSSLSEYQNQESESLLKSQEVLKKFANSSEYVKYVQNLEDYKANFETIKNLISEKLLI